MAPTQTASMTLAQLTKHLQGQHARVSGVVNTIADKYNVPSYTRVKPLDEDALKVDLNALTTEINQAWQIIGSLMNNLGGMAQRAAQAEAKLDEKKIVVIGSMSRINGK